MDCPLHYKHVPFGTHTICIPAKYESLSQFNRTLVDYLATQLKTGTTYHTNDDIIDELISEFNIPRETATLILDEFEITAPIPSQSTRT